MVERKRPSVQPPPPPPPPPERSVSFLPSGSTMLNLVLGGGWAQGRCVNLVGDKSSGKTLLAIEACANHALLYGAKSIRYAEAEAAFDADYARMVGMPKGLELTDGIRTVEDFDSDIEAWVKHAKGLNTPSLYILDSLDSLSDAAEMGRTMEDSSYGASKAKKMSEMFRRRIREIEDANCTLFIISQLRDKIGVTFGETQTRVGGRALDFFASQVIWLSEISKKKRTIMGVERVVGTQVRARAKKNKVAPPFREAEFHVQFNYGVDDEISMLEWLKKYKFMDPVLARLDMSENKVRSVLASARERGERDVLDDFAAVLRDVVTDRWMAIEAALQPTMSKYGDV